MKKSWQYKLRNFTSVNVGAFEKFFENMPYDPYVNGNFRKRRYSSLKQNSNGDFEIQPHKKFLQKSDVNDLLGDVEREYEELDEKLIKSKNFKQIVEGFINLTRIDPTKTEIGIHQIRIHSSIYINGEPAPEGRHKDGFDFVGIFCAKRQKITGGESELFLNKDDFDEDAILRKLLKENEMLVVNDKEVFHNATKLNPTGVDLGYRDVFVFTA